MEKILKFLELFHKNRIKCTRIKITLFFSFFHPTVSLHLNLGMANASLGVPPIRSDLTDVTC